MPGAFLAAVVIGYVIDIREGTLVAYPGPEEDLLVAQEFWSGSISVRRAGKRHSRTW